MSQRTERYQVYINEGWLEQPVHIIGVGAIGRQVALQCAAMGFKTIYLYDPDTVEEVNMGTQGYHPGQIDLLKVVATAADLTEINPEIHTEFLEENFSRLLGNTDNKIIVFVCVDTMEARKQIADILQRRDIRNLWLIDGRMRRTTIRIVSADESTLREYEENLYSDSETEPGRCTAQTTIFMASVAAGLLINRWVQYQRGTNEGYMDNLFDPEICLKNLIVKEVAKVA